MLVLRIIKSGEPVLSLLTIIICLFAGLSVTNVYSSEISNSTAITLDNVEKAKQSYLSTWNQTNFNSTFDTFVASNPQGYGIYDKKDANVIFSPEEQLILYLEPVGFGHKQVSDVRGDHLYVVNLTVDAIISDKEGQELQKYEKVFDFKLVSYNKRTELFLAPVLQPNPPLSEGDYIISYDIKDGSSGKNFLIVKNVKIAKTFEPGIG